MDLHTCLLTNNSCYKTGAVLKPKGVMIHSTGANNKTLKRYVQPDDGLLGKNPYNNHWNRSGLSKCTHAFIGTLKDGSVATYQTLPWDMRGWHCGRGSKGTANDTHISFEICEDGLNDKSYFKKIYQEAVELTAYLCKEFDLNPLKDGVVICHAEGAKRGIASSHEDVLHWWPRFGVTMDDFRNDVAKELKKFSVAVSAPNATIQKNQIEVPILKKGSKGEAVKTIQVILTQKGYNVKGIDGSWGPGLDAAFMQWQKDVGLKADKICGTASWTKLLLG